LRVGRSILALLRENVRDKNINVESRVNCSFCYAFEQSSRNREGLALSKHRQKDPNSKETTRTSRDGAGEQIEKKHERCVAGICE
jgi:hypothetical protein